MTGSRISADISGRCIKQYHHFRFDADAPGMCFVKKTSEDEEVAIKLLVSDPADIPRDRPVAAAQKR